MRKKDKICGTAVITSGKFKGKTILTPGGKTHPMGSREKIALFNMLADWLPGAFMMDAYAGSGALGIEAISRGAGFVLFMDNDPRACSIIKHNMEQLGIYGKHGGPLMADVEKESKTATDRFLIVLADPPYDTYRPEMITSVSRLVASGGIMAASTPEPGPEIKGMVKVREKKYARAHITLYMWEGAKWITD